jgi:hypothetical protein
VCHRHRRLAGGYGSHLWPIWQIALRFLLTVCYTFGRLTLQFR